MPALAVAHSVKCQLACESLHVSGSLRLKVNGWSMVPSIWPGDTLIITSLDHTLIFPGDVALYQRSGRLFIHRVIAISGNERNRQAVMRGDSLPQADPPVRSRDLLGKVQCILRHGKEVEPARILSVPQRAVAALMQRSEFGARVVFGARQIYQTLQRPTREN